MAWCLETERLRLRHFTADDVPAILALFSDPEVNTFLPWWPLKDEAEAEAFYRTRLQGPYCCAICLKDRIEWPIGYIKVDPEGAHDLGYALSCSYWHQGITAEAGAALLKYVVQEGIPFVTATHDRNNPHSGAVMRKLGLTYRYSCVEQWQPKDFPVVFRMYQRNFSVPQDFTFKKYWEQSTEHMIEAL